MSDAACPQADYTRVYSSHATLILSRKSWVKEEKVGDFKKVKYLTFKKVKYGGISTSF